ncbi:MAG: hypothetical protein JWR50_3000, partial [Mucilaginibacter sp.]|nr:hypothetical protein [Mucilaginibacter sp.]
MDIKEVISRRVTLEEREGYALGKCPFHQGDRKTLMVIAELDHYVCFCCGREGNADDFIIRLKQAECVAAPVKRKDWRGTVYVLKLVGACYYVGYTRCLKRRWKKHLNGKGAYWTQAHPPLGVVEFFENAPFEMENEVTERYIRRYGWEKVRGGDY